jgi:hypothetical protein
MTRDLSSALKEQLFTPFRDEDFRLLLTVDHPTFAQPFRFVSGDPNELASLTSNGATFTTFPFELALLSDEDGEPQAQIRVQNVDDRIGSTLLGLPDDTVSVRVQVVLRASPDVIEYDAQGLELVDVQVDAIAVRGALRMRGLSTEPVPGRILTSIVSPVLFR